MATLDELKKENAADEKAVTQDPPADPPADPPQDPPEEPKADDPPKEEDPPADPPEPDDWMKGEEEPAPQFTDSDVAKVRRKYKAEAKATKEENVELRKELDELKKKIETPVPAQTTDKPKREAFKTVEDYAEALTDWKLKNFKSENQSVQAAQQKEQAKKEHAQKVAAAVDEHYGRAVKLSEKSGIKPETYQAADRVVREAIDSIFPDTGDAVTDALISSIGAGSEKVFYNLGVNPARRAELVKLLNEDRSGIKAAVYLGRLNTELSAPAKRESKAPDPPDPIQGDKANKGGDGGKLKKAYDAAKDDVQKRLDLKKQAKAQGIDTKAW